MNARVRPVALLVGAGALGFTARVTGGPSAPAERAAAAMTAVLAVAVIGAACCGAAQRDLGDRMKFAAVAAGTTWAAAAAAGLAAGGPVGGVLGGALVPAAMAALALGLAGALRALGSDARLASFWGAAAALAPAALLFVADPWIEKGRGAADRAALVLTVHPLAAMTSGDGGVGVDWQRMALLYDGPNPGWRLSLVGDYAPQPPEPVAWSLCVLGIGVALVAVSRRRDEPAGPGAGFSGDVTAAR